MTPLNEILENLGPLRALAGNWEGLKGKDIAPDDNRGTETNLYRERMTFEPFGPVDNHEQRLWGLRYTTTAWRLGEPDPYHEESGYWMWDPREKQVMRCFIVPRGITVIAGGTVDPSSTRISLVSQLGSPVYGISASPFLDREFKTTRYELTINVLGSDSISYEEDTQLLMKGHAEVFHHKDANTLNRVN
jgi:hypothetical protein